MIPDRMTEYRKGGVIVLVVLSGAATVLAGIVWGLVCLVS